MAEKHSKNAISEKQDNNLKRLTKKFSWRLPRGIKSHRTLTSNWLTVALAIESGADLINPESESDRKAVREVPAACAALAAHYAFNAPASFSRNDLTAWIAALGKFVPTPEGDKLLQYWQDALAYCDLNELVKEGLDIAPDLKAETLPQALPPLRGLDLGTVDEGRIAAVLMAYFISPRQYVSALFAIPLAIEPASQRFIPVPSGAAPFFNREWLEPVDPDREKPAYFGAVSDCEKFVHDQPPTVSASWPDYWSYVESFVRAIAGGIADIRHLAQLVDAGDTHWKIVPWKTQGAGVAIDAVYQQVLDGAPAPLLRQLIKPPFSPDTIDEARALAMAPQMTGHMDTYNANMAWREGFGLERSQRVAATAMTATAAGQILAINGPPGTGKTSFLRAVIATCWVDAALLGNDPPILLATAATNKAVTNIIESFSAIPGPAGQPDWSSRWLPSLPSYGWFFPAASKKDEEFAGFMLLRKVWDSGEAAPYALRGAASEFATAAVDQRAWLVDEFLDLHRRCAGLPQAEASAALAAVSIQRQLSASVADMRALQHRFADWLATAQSNAALAQPLAHWAEQEGRVSHAMSVIEAQHTRLTSTLVTLTNALAHVSRAEALEARGRAWWARLLRPIVGDRWGPQATALRSTALAEITTRTPEERPPEPFSADALQRHVAELQRRVATNADALNQARAAVIAAQRTRQQVEAWRVEAIRLVQGASSAAGFEVGAPDAWCGQAIAAPTELALTFEAAIDRKFRFLHFHIAARYWEARWLADVPTHADSADELTTLRRVAMLAPVIVSTAYSLPRIQRAFGFADLLIFDESGQASPEIGAASFAFAKRAIVVGDTAQLKPVWSLDTAGSARLAMDRDIEEVPPAVSSCSGSIMEAAQGVTLFTDQAANAQGPGINLKAHYRCRADIIEYNRRLLYGDLLMPCRRETPPFIYPAMAWVAVAPRRGARRQQSSWVNEDEVDEIVRWLEHEGPRLLAHYNKTALSQIVAVIAPFRAQATELQKALKKKFGDAAQDMVINTVHALQGAEKPIVAFSLTQTTGSFFVESDGPNMLNVAVSRAQDSFILFAAPDVLQRTGHSKRERTPLNLLIDYLAERGKRLYPRECVIIEAPGKQHVVEDALGLSARVIATHGHFRELISSTQGVRFQTSKEKTMEHLRQAAAEMGQYDAIYLATDDDEDGEEIAWHVMQVLQEAGVRGETKFRRMRFYALTPKEIRRARELALPGIDARRVKISLMRKLVDMRLHEALRRHGVTASRPELALLREVVNRSTQPPKFGIRVMGHCGGQTVAGNLMEGAGSMAQPRRFADRATAEATIAQLKQRTALQPVHRFDLQQVGAWYPANTTAQVMVHAYRQWQWMPTQTMEALRALYEGKASPRAIGAGDRRETGA